MSKKSLNKTDERRTHLTAAEAAQHLGVTESTLYAYVSRGLIRSEDCEGSKRTRKYRTEDILRLSERKELRKNPDRAAENALSWGAPILDSAITLFSEGHLFYRGYDALDLARDKSFEEVTSLLWTGYFPEKGVNYFADSPVLTNLITEIQPAYDHTLTVFEKAQLILPLLAAGDITMHDLRPATVASSARKIMSVLLQIATGGVPLESISTSLQRYWAPGDPSAARIFNAALVLSADHELDPSTFTARCVASTRSHPCAVVGACLSAVQGQMYREKYFQIERLFNEVERAGSAKGAVAQWVQDGVDIPGFTHPLYPEGDPRAKFILDMLADDLKLSQPAGAKRLRLIFDVVREVEQVLHEKPVLELGLFAVAVRFDLDLHSARALFMLGRSAGWMAHAIEQYQVREFFRPRARYVGEPPRK